MFSAVTVEEGRIEKESLDLDIIWYEGQKGY